MLYTEPSVIAKMAANAFLLGALFELLLEAIRLFEGLAGLDRCRHFSLWLFFRDVIYITACGIWFCVFLYASNNGKIRAVALLCLAFGYIICYKTVGRFIRRVAERLILLLHRILFWLTRPFVLLAVQAVRLLKWITAPVFSRAGDIFSEIKSKHKK